MDGEGRASFTRPEHHLQSPPILTVPLPREDLLLYIAATTHVVSSVILIERGEEGHAFGV
jgi:hypothetical protein